MRKQVAKKLLPNSPPWVGDWSGRLGKWQPPIVCVTWMDACIHGNLVLETDTPGWRDIYSPGSVMKTTGFLLRNDDTWVTLAMESHIERSGGFRQVQDIPKIAVCELKVLDEGILPETSEGLLPVMKGKKKIK